MGASLEVMERDALKMRGGLPTIFASLKAGHNSDKIFEKIRKLAVYSLIPKIILYNMKFNFKNF